MGSHLINSAEKGTERALFIYHLLRDLESLEIMLAENKIEKAPIRIGAEQEFCVVDNDWTPSSKSLEILERINDPHFTTELALYNLEINLDPLELKAGCFHEMMRNQVEFLHKANEICSSQNTKPLLAGILPSISSRHIEMAYMTPSPRYQVLNDIMRKLRGTDFSLHIQGTDELTILHDSVLFEACNTSYQMHLQIDPDDFVASYNWSQAIAGPLLTISTNSPLLLGRELWHETRIALFQQSIDTRSSTYSLRQNEPRVTFGNEWIKNSVTDIYKDDIAKFQLIVSTEIREDSLDVLKDGRIPKLDALSLHNGTVYRWNRACYGVGKGIPHLRIENRYIPSGPTVIDEIANLAMWVGVMKGRPEAYDEIWSHMEFKDAKSNFIKAARTGKESQMRWMGKVISSDKLILDILLPLAHEGLKKIGIDEDEANYYLSIIKRRTLGTCGADWQIRNYRNLKKKTKKDNALKMLCAEMYKNQQTNTPVSEWPDIDPTKTADESTKHDFVYEIMTTELFTVREDDPANLVAQIMQWKNIHHVPVENEENKLVGLLTWQIINEYAKSENDTLLVNDIMVRDVITVTKKERIEPSSELMIRNEIGCLPVIKDKKLIGLITKSDLT